MVDSVIPADVVVEKLETALKGTRSLRFARPILVGRVHGRAIELWRDRRNGNSSFYPVLRLTVRPAESGSVLEGTFGYRSKAVIVVGFVLGAIVALVIASVDPGPEIGLAARAVAAMVALAVFPLLAWLSSRFWAVLLSGDKELLIRDLKEILSDEGV